MEEKVVEVKTEQVKEVVEEKKKGKISKKMLAIGAGVLALGVGAIALVLSKGNKSEDSYQNQFVDTSYESVVEEQNSEITE